MVHLIEQNRRQITAVCEKHGVKRLELFGSAAHGEFNPVSSDLDFLVEFLAYDTPTIADQWFGLQEDLQKLLGRPVDLTSLRTAKNPYFLQTANRQKVTLYAA
jgi:uncharacterized protein